MSNIDKSLGELISSRKTASTRGRAPRRGGRGPAKGPAGGVTKNTTTKATANTRGATKAGGRAVPNAPAAAAKGGNKKILVSGLPLDVGDSHLKEYFGTRVGPISRTEVSYDQRGKSRGIATVIFRQPLAEKAVAEHNGITIDGKKLRVEVVYDAAHLPSADAPKSLSDRITKPKEVAAKDKPRKAEVGKKERNGAAASKEGRGAKRGRNAGRPKKKTAEELDAEMTDYFGPGQGAQSNGDAATLAATTTTTAPAADAMDDEVL